MSNTLESKTKNLTGNGEETLPPTDGTQEEEEPKKKRKSQTFAERVARADLMAASILTHTAILTARGMDEAFSQNLKALADSLRAMNAEQEELKGTLKEKTSELNAKMVELNKTVRSVHQIVKIDLPKERWTDFGINAKH